MGLLSGQPIVLAQLFAAALALLIAMTVHEFSHNYVGYRMGDPTPRDMGRLTLNPMVHINWIGWLMWVVIGFGILGSAPINENRMRDRRWGFFWAVAAGPLSNLGLAIFAAILFRLHLWHDPFRIVNGDIAAFGPRDIIPTFDQFMWVFLNFNLLLFLFNLLPVFPFDGWHMLRKLLPPPQAAIMERYQMESMYIFLGLILLSFIGVDILGRILNPPLYFLLRLLLGG